MRPSFRIQAYVFSLTYSIGITFVVFVFQICFPNKNLHRFWKFGECFISRLFPFLHLRYSHGCISFCVYFLSLKWIWYGLYWQATLIYSKYNLNSISKMNWRNEVYITTVRQTEIAIHVVFDNNNRNVLWVAERIKRFIEQLKKFVLKRGEKTLLVQRANKQDKNGKSLSFCLLY